MYNCIININTKILDFPSGTLAGRGNSVVSDKNKAFMTNNRQAVAPQQKYAFSNFNAVRTSLESLASLPIALEDVCDSVVIC